tara:strand:+ start:1584 stop:1979 length:396 start_codon:yes stop_codon:yes gene_type:complete
MLKVFVLIGVLIISYFSYLTWWKSIPEIPQIAFVLQNHFQKSGIQTKATSIPYSVGGVVAHIEYTIDDYPVAISVSVYQDENEAKKALDSIEQSPNLNFPIQNGELLLFLVHGEEDDMKKNILKAFRSLEI